MGVLKFHMHFLNSDLNLFGSKFFFYEQDNALKGTSFLINFTIKKHLQDSCSEGRKG